MAAKLIRARDRFAFDSIARTINKSTTAAVVSQTRIEGGAKRGQVTSIAPVRAVVVNVTVAVFTLDPSRVTD